MKRAIWVGLAYAFMALAAAGLFLPLLPTTPFLLLAAFCATRGSDSLRRRLYEHPRFGPMLEQWDERQAVPLSGKLLSAAGLIFAGWMGFGRIESVAGRVVLVVCLVAISAYVWSRPAPVEAAESELMPD